MSAPLTAISQHAVPVTRSGQRRHAPGGKPNLTLVREVPARASARCGGGAIDTRRLDGESRAWLDALHSDDPRREEAIGRLHALLMREARFDVGRRTASLSHPSGRDLDDLAVQAANDAVVSILAKLDQFRGESLFTTWARRFVEREAPAKIRRRVGRAGEHPSEDGFEHGRMWAVNAESPHELSVAKETAQTLARAIAEDLTARQREVLLALTVDGVPTQDLARRLNTTTGALYKTLHDARRKLKAGLAAV